MVTSDFSYRLIGTTGCEILCDGEVVAWAVDALWAAIIVALLNNNPRDAVGAGIGMPNVACCCGGPDSRNEQQVVMKERNMNIQEEPLSKAGIEEVAINHGLEVEVVANRAALQAYLLTEVEAGNMPPSNAVALYCERLDLGDENVMDVAEEFTGFCQYEAALTEIDTVLDHDDLPEVFDYLDEQAQ